MYMSLNKENKNNSIMKLDYLEYYFKVHACLSIGSHF